QAEDGIRVRNVTGVQTCALPIFKYYLKLLYKKPWSFIEFVLSLMQPNVAVILLLFLIIFYASFNFISSIEHTYICHLVVFYLIEIGRASCREIVFVLCHVVLCLL